MHKSEIVKAVAHQTGLSLDRARFAVDAAIGVIQETLAAGKDVKIAGFGKFYAVQRKARKGSRPGTGEEITIPARTVVRFRAGKELREAVEK